MVYQLLSYGIYKLVISVHPLFSENLCELFRNSLHIGERDADTGTVFFTVPLGLWVAPRGVLKIQVVVLED